MRRILIEYTMHGGRLKALSAINDVPDNTSYRQIWRRIFSEISDEDLELTREIKIVSDTHEAPWGP